MYTDLYKPFRKAGSLANEIENLSQRCFGRAVNTGPLTGEWLQPLEVYETKSEVTYKTELPLSKPEEIEISINEDVLTVHVEKEGYSNAADANHHLLGERFYGSVSHHVNLPGDVMINYIDARYEAGVLTIRIPKMRKSIHKKIRLKTEPDVRSEAISSKIDQAEDDFDDYGIIDLMGWSI